MVRVVCAFVLVVGLSVVTGCSQQKREETIDRVSNAASALNGGGKSAEKEHETPLIVQEQQKKERIRQNTEWTPENQKLHPIEYCQAKLTELDKYSEKLEVASYKLATEQNKVQRKVEDNEKQMKSLQKFLDEAKSKYKEAEAAGKWPMELNGFYLTKEKAQEKIVEASRKIQQIAAQVNTPKNQLTMLEKKQKIVQDEQRRVILLKDKIQSTINDLKTQQVIEGEKGITAAINALNDSMGALSVDVNSPDLDDLAMPSSGNAREEEFNAIMGK